MMFRRPLHYLGQRGVSNVRCVGHVSVLRCFGHSVMKSESGLSTSPSLALDICAHIVAPQVNQSFHECKEFLLHNPEHVEEFEDNMKKIGLTVVYSDEEVSVIDAIPDQDEGVGENVEILERSLHINRDFSFIQTAVNINAKTKALHHDQLLNLETSNYIITLLFSLVLHFANQPISINKSSHLNAGVKRCAVLGAGGCVLPIILSSLLPPVCEIEAVELNEHIINVAMKYFSASNYISNVVDFRKDKSNLAFPEVNNKFKLYSSCGIKWLSNEMRRNNPQKIDMLYVDIFDGDSQINKNENTIINDVLGEANEDFCFQGESGDSNAPFSPPSAEDFMPSTRIINKNTLLLMADSLSTEGGLLAINMLGKICSIREVAKWMDNLLNSTQREKDQQTLRYHVGCMKVPITINKEGKKQSHKNFNQRDNMIIFIIKNPKIQNFSRGAIEGNFNQYVSMYEDSERPQSHIPLPFANEEFISQWISLYDTIDSSD